MTRHLFDDKVSLNILNYLISTAVVGQCPLLWFLGGLGGQLYLLLNVPTDILWLLCLVAETNLAHFLIDISCTFRQGQIELQVML